jgi:K(+)-stimulated pyrophosphate-energized sodium pump
MAADLFETYAVTIVATMLLGGLVMVAGRRAVLVYPLASWARLHHLLDHRHFLRVASRRRQDHERLIQGCHRLGLISAVAFWFITKSLMGRAARPLLAAP